MHRHPAEWTQTQKVHINGLLCPWLRLKHHIMSFIHCSLKEMSPLLWRKKSAFANIGPKAEVKFPWKSGSKSRNVSSNPTAWPQAHLWISGALVSSRVKQCVGHEPGCGILTLPGLWEAIYLRGGESQEGLASSTWGRSLACFPLKVLLSSLRPGNGPNLWILMRVSF